jgi:uncharacterized membrane protein SpoIIM required for sporulation
VNSVSGSLTPVKRWSILDKRWIRLAFLMFVVEVILFYIIASIPIGASEARSLTDSYNSVQSSLQTTNLVGRALLIFGNNVKIALMDMVPVWGAILFSISTYTTSRTIEAIAYLQPSTVAHLPPQVLITLLFLFPHSWLELPAYAIAFTESIYITYSIFTHNFTNELRRVAAVLVFVVFLLFIAALFESAEITYPSYALALWAPAVFLIIITYIFLRRYYTAGRKSENTFTFSPPGEGSVNPSSNN